MRIYFSQYVKLFSRRIDLVNGVDIPFSILLRSMRILFGENCIVEFVCV